MIKIVTFICAIALTVVSNKSTGQASMPGSCGTGVSDVQRNWLNDYVQKGRNANFRKSGATHYVPLYFHIVGDNDGKGYYGRGQLLEEICQLNHQYEPVGFYFTFAGLEYINSTAYFDHDYGVGQNMMDNYNRPNAANIYIVLNPAGNCGYFSWGGDAIAIGKSCMGTGATTMAHELGHFFSLPHPFDNVNGEVEYVNGTNCGWAGDLFCDTRADFLDYRWQCPYMGTKTDPMGDKYNPDETLYMSYSADRCANRFTTEQIDAMNFNLQNIRTYLDKPAVDTSVFTQKSTPLWPPNSVTANNSHITLKWSSVPGAKWYVLQATQISVFTNNLPLDVVVKDTVYYATTLLSDKTYRWRVRPVKEGRTCSEFSDVGIFNTSSTAAGIGNIEGKTINLYPNPTNGSLSVFMTFDNSLQTNEATIYSAEGKQIGTKALEVKGTNLYEMNIEGLAKGFYWILVQDGETDYRQKLLVQ